MLIKSIKIENFQSYYQEQSMEFSTGLNLIIGNGGKGKSKLFNAFYWVLFGKIYITGVGWCSTDALPHSAKLTMKRHEFINKRALSEAKDGDSVKCSVTLVIEDDNNKEYSIERSVVAHRIGDGHWNNAISWEVPSNYLKVYHEIETGTSVLDGIMAEDKINNLFPEGIRNYIWFQGESLENLINFRNKETLKAAVKHISYFPYYEKMSEIISLSKTKIERKESEAKKQVNRQNQEINNILSKLDSVRHKIEVNEAEEKKHNSEIDKISLILAEDETKMTGLASYSALVQKYTACQNQIQGYHKKLRENYDNVKKYLTSTWILRGIEPMLEDCKRIIAEHKEYEDTMPEKKYLEQPGRAKLEEILNSTHQCFVCGSRVEKGDDTYKWIVDRIHEQEKYLKELEEYHANMQMSKHFNMFVGKIQDYPDSLLVKLSTIDKNADNLDEEADRLRAARSQYQGYIDKYDKQIDDIKKKNGVDPVTQANQAGVIGNTIKATRSNLNTLTHRLETLKKQIAELKQEEKLLEGKLEGLERTDTSIVQVPETRWKNLSVFMDDICKRVRENARLDLLHKLEERSNKFYAKFTEHDRGYKGKVSISDDYNIEFDPGLNTSHEHRKKMSIINALLSLNQEAMDTYYPFITDAPSSSFDLATTHKYLVGMQDIFHQSIILTKDVEVGSDKYKDLYSQPKITQIFHLESNIFPEAEGKEEPGIHEVATKITRLK